MENPPWPNFYSSGVIQDLVDLQCDLTTVTTNVLSASFLESLPLLPSDIHYAFKIAVGRHEHHLSYRARKLDLNKLSVIETIAFISFKDKSSRGNWGYEMMKRFPYEEFAKYKDCLSSVPYPIILTHPNVFELFTGCTKSSEQGFVYLIDGLHRVMSSLEAGVNELDAYVVVRNVDLDNFK